MNLWFYLVSGVNQGNDRERGESKIFLCYPKSLGASAQSFRDQYGVKVLVKCLQMIKPMVVGFLSYRRLMLLWVMAVRFENTCSFREVKFPQDYPKTLWMGMQNFKTPLIIS